jgi:hypothetical protein
MASDYPGLIPIEFPSKFKSPEGTKFENFKVKNIQNEFFMLPKEPEYLAAKIPKGLFPNRRYTSHTLFSNNKLKNHFQGIQRLRQSNYFFLSAGDSTGKFAQYYLVHVNPHSQKQAPIGSNLLNKGKAPSTDKLVELFHLNKGKNKYWHAGGMGIMGDILAVPLENPSENASEIVFYNLKDPLNPMKYPFSIERKKVKAGGVDVCKMDNGFFLCAVWTDSGVKDPLFQFYISKSTNFDDGFKSKEICSVIYPHFINQKHKIVRYQSIQFVVEKSGAIYMIGAENFSGAAPTFNAKNYIELLKIDTKSEISNTTTPSHDLIKIARNDEYVFNKADPFANFDAGAGIYVDEEGRMALYAAYHWRSGEYIKFGEYYGGLKVAKSINDPEFSRFELYEHRDFEGRRIRIYGTGRSHLPNYENLKAQDKGFAGKLSSVAFQLPKGFDYVLYEKPNFKGKKKILKGTGKPEWISNLGNFSDDTHSSRIEKS